EMNTQLLNAKSLFSIAVIAACVALSGPVQAESHKVMVKIPVSAAGLDLNQPAGASELYSRLRQAARTACRDGGRVGLEPVKNFTGCCEQALGGAIMIAIAIFGALASSMSAVCTAADSTDAPQSTVKYEDL